MKKEKIFWGLFFIFGAVFIIFGRLGYLREVSVFSLMLTIFFAAMLIKSLMHLEYTGILFSIAFLCIIYAGPLGITTSLSGYNVSNIEALLFIGQNTLIAVGQLLFFFFLFASLGAVMDESPLSRHGRY